MRIQKGNYEVSGVVTASLPNTMFRVELEAASGSERKAVLVTLKGSLRRRFTRIFPGDRVRIEMTPYDTERGRIVYKY